MTPADVACESDNTFTVVREVEQQWLKTASVRSELVPNNFTEQYDSNIILNLQKNAFVDSDTEA